MISCFATMKGKSFWHSQQSLYWTEKSFILHACPVLVVLYCTASPD